MMVAAVPALALAGLTAAAGLLLWDGRRRAVMRKRLDRVASSAKSSLDQVAPTPAGVGRD